MHLVINKFFVCFLFFLSLFFVLSLSNFFYKVFHFKQIMLAVTAFLVTFWSHFGRI